MLQRIITPRSIITYVLLISISFSFFIIVFLISNDDSSFRLPLQDLVIIRWCKPLRKIPGPRNPVGLISAPGCGNTWLRFLLQQATGILTGSVYNDTYLKMVAFPGEIYDDGSVLVVKSHYNIKKTRKLVPFDSIILLLRNPRDSILATYNMDYAKSIEFKQEYNSTYTLINFHSLGAPPSVFKNPPARWWAKFDVYLKKWTELYTEWLTKYHGPMHVVFYENLVNNTRNELEGILDFLNVTVSESDINCANDKKNDLDNIFRRPKKYRYFDPFTKSMYKRMELAENRVYGLVKH